MHIPDVSPRRSPWARVAVISMGVLVIVAVAILVGTLYLSVRQTVREAQSRVLPPAVQYTAKTYLPEKSVLCPGDSLVFTNTLEINREAIIWFVVSWYDLNKGQTVGPDDGPTYRPIPAPVAQRSRRREIPIPKLPAGRYEYRLGVAEGTSEPSIYTVPFTIPGDCPYREIPPSTPPG